MQDIPLLDQIRFTFELNLHYLPLYVVWLAGIVFAIRRWRKHPKASLFALLGMLTLLISSLVERYTGMWLPLSLQEQGLGGSQISVTVYYAGQVYVVVNTVAWGLLLVALFRWRGETK